MYSAVDKDVGKENGFHDLYDCHAAMTLLRESHVEKQITRHATDSHQRNSATACHRLTLDDLFHCADGLAGSAWTFTANIVDRHLSWVEQRLSR
jgi:hypothetical protein